MQVLLTTDGSACAAHAVQALGSVPDHVPHHDDGAVMIIRAVAP